MRFPAVVALLLMILVPAVATAAPARLVEDLNTGFEPYPSGTATSFTAYTPVRAGVVFFAFFKDVTSCELWATDGTAAGTEWLADLCGQTVPEDTESFSVRVLATNGDVAFLTDRLGHLWRSDGTRAGTFVLSTVVVKQNFWSLGPDRRTLFFTGCGPGRGCELWKSDGTRQGTRLVRAFTSDSRDSNIGPYILWEGRLVLGVDGALWTTDGTAAGTVRLSVLGREIRSLVRHRRALYVVSLDRTLTLWVLFPGDREPRRLHEFPADNRVNYLQVFPVGNRVLIVSALDDDNGGVETTLWETNGTPRGTVQLAAFGSVLSGVTRFGDRVLFTAAARDERDGRLWTLEDGSRRPQVLRGCPDGCPLVEDEAPMVVFRGRLFFTGEDEIHGLELWSSNGTPQGTRLVKDLCPGACDGLPHNYRIALGRLLFDTQTDELWTTDGTSAGTVRVAPLPPEGSFFHPDYGLVERNGRVYFTGFDPEGGAQPWTSDLAGHTGPVTVLGGGLAAGQPFTSGLQALGDRALLTACTPSGERPFTSDGTAAGTVPLPLPERSCGSEFFPGFTVVGDLAFFVWDAKLWRTDGTPAGTVSLGPPIDPFLRASAAVGGRFLFVLDPELPSTGPGTEWSFWTSDGTPEGTVEAFRLRLGGSPNLLAASGDEAYFVAQSPDEPFPVTLWRTDGTAAGTRKILSLGASILQPEIARLGETVWSSPRRTIREGEPRSTGRTTRRPAPRRCSRTSTTRGGRGAPWA
jgi:ELWxxDGT repeat protein